MLNGLSAALTVAMSLAIYLFCITELLVGQQEGHLACKKTE